MTTEMKTDYKKLLETVEYQKNGQNGKAPGHVQPMKIELWKNRKFE